MFAACFFGRAILHARSAERDDCVAVVAGEVRLDNGPARLARASGGDRFWSCGVSDEWLVDDRIPSASEQDHEWQ